MTRPVAWHNLIIGDMKVMDDDHLDAARRTCECQGTTIGHGISAIGHLLAVAADSGEMGNAAARDIGWLLESLGELSANLADTQRAAAWAQAQRKGDAA